MLNLSTRTLTRNGEQVPITTGEFSVLKVFARHPKIPLSRDKLMELARGRGTSLRPQPGRADFPPAQADRAEPVKPVFIQTVWGLGYVFVPDGGS